MGLGALRPKGPAAPRGPSRMEGCSRLRPRFIHHDPQNVSRRLSKLTPDPSKTLPKPFQNQTPHPSKILQQSAPEPLKSFKNHSWRPLVFSWLSHGPSWPPEANKKEKKTKNRSSDLPPGLLFWDGFRAMLALCSPTLRSESAWKPHFVNVYIELAFDTPTWPNLSPS